MAGSGESRARVGPRSGESRVIGSQAGGQFMRRAFFAVPKVVLQHLADVPLRLEIYAI